MYHRDYYWDFGVMSQQNQATALLAQLDELNYINFKVVDFQMLLSDKSLNIMENFKVDDFGVPQWNIKKDPGDIEMMKSVFLLKNRENFISSSRSKHKNKKKKSGKSKRKLDILTSTDDTRERGLSDGSDFDIEILNHGNHNDDNDEIKKDQNEKPVKDKKPKKKKKKHKDKDKGDKDEKSKRKKKKKDRERKKKKKHKNHSSQSLLYVCYNFVVFYVVNYIGNNRKKKGADPTGNCGG